MKKILILTIFVLGGLMFLGKSGSVALAYQIENLDLSVEGDIVVGPGKIELWGDPGEKLTRELTITNRTGGLKLFKIEIEDFRGSRDPEKSVQFLGEEKGPYSLRDYIHPEITEFNLSQGQKMRLSVEISIPEDAEPGGLYGSVLVAALNPEEEGFIEEEKAKGQVKIVTRIASLLFVRVKGEVEEDGALKDFKAEKNFYEKGPILFRILSENNGSVHLNPYGIIEIKNILGRKIGEVEVDPWFVMPDSLRAREIKWERGFLFGKYTATLSLNRGYQDIVDQKSFEFWVIPWKIISVGFIGLIAVIWFIVWIAGHFEIKRKSPSVQ